MKMQSSSVMEKLTSTCYLYKCRASKVKFQITHKLTSEENDVGLLYNILNKNNSSDDLRQIFLKANLAGSGGVPTLAVGVWLQATSG